MRRPLKSPFKPLGSVLFGLYTARRSMVGGPGHRGPPTDHFDGMVFRNTVGGAGKSFADFWRWQRTRRPKPWPAWVDNSATPAILVDPETYEVRADGELLTCEPLDVLPLAQRYFLF